MALKQVIAEILDFYTLNEREYALKTKKLRINLEYLKDIGDNLTDLV